MKALEDEKNDRVMQHSLTYALIEIGDVEEVREGLKNDHARVKSAVLLALNAIPNAMHVASNPSPEQSAISSRCWKSQSRDD